MTSHAGRDNTYGSIKDRFYNVTQDDVSAFVKTCPACQSKNVSLKKLPGAKKPITSSDFRTRFQIDLIDKRSNPQDCIYGVTRRWIMTVKDHFTGFAALEALPRKRPKYVAWELLRIFALIGYPKIFHTDNGNEFTANEIIEFLKSINPGILSVTGRPRRPSDQGSVENLNKFGKRLITASEDEERIKNPGSKPNWVALLPKIAISLNSMPGKDVNNTAPYSAVFGMDYHDGLEDTVDEVRKCKTVEELLKKYPNEGLEKTAREYCELREGDDDEDDNSPPPNDYWEDTSDDEEDEKGESMDFDKKPGAKPADHIPKQKPATTPTPKKPIDRDNPSKSKTVKDILLKTDGDKLVYTKLCGIKAALAHKDAKIMTRQGKQYKFIYPTLQCNCCFSGENLLSIPDEKYLLSCSNTIMWWHSDFIATFAALAAHQDHFTVGKTTRVQLMHIPYPNAIVRESEKSDLAPSIEIIASIVHDVDHYAVLEVNLSDKVVTVVDGLGVSTERWLNHVICCFIRCKLLDDDEDTFEVRRITESARSKNDTWELTWGDNMWIVKPGEFLSQRNGWDCGPIACAKICDLYDLWPKDGKFGKLRPFIISKYKAFLEGDTTNINVYVPTIELLDDSLDGTEEKDVDETKSEVGTNEENTKCVVCFDALRTSETTIMDCCGASIHALCVSKWLSNSPLCVFCRREVRQITFQGAVIPFGDEIVSHLDSTKSTLKFDINTVMTSDSPTPRHRRMRAATKTKRKRQDTSAEKMIKMREKHSSEVGASVGAIVRIGNDARDVQDPRSTMGVIVEIGDAGGVVVCTEWGVVVHGNRRKEHWITSDRYEVVARADDEDGAVIRLGLASVREEVRSGKFDKSGKDTVTLQECHKRFVGSSPVRATPGCKCGMGTHGKKSCTANCGCIKKKVACTSKCICNGNCTTNPLNNKK